MRLIGGSCLLTNDVCNPVVRDAGILIRDGVIEEVGDFEALSKYASSRVFYQNSFLTPAFINSHIHFEFSKSCSSFKYGSFSAWLSSVMLNRNVVLADNGDYIRLAIDEQLGCGVGTVGAVSSYDTDLELLSGCGLRVVYFTEVIGADASKVDTNIALLESRLAKARMHSSDTFTPALAIHSPYSVSRELAVYAISLARQKGMPLSAHFLESKEELEWLSSSTGFFESFYKNVLGLEPKSSFSPGDFLDLFFDTRFLLVHCLFSDRSLLDRILSMGGHIVSCPRSNMLLSLRMGSNNILATDGRSSNYNLDILDELRLCLFSTIARSSGRDLDEDGSCCLGQLCRDDDIDLESISQDLFRSVTINPARALCLNNGSLEGGKFADISVFSMGGMFEFKSEDVYLPFILSAKKASMVFVNGRECMRSRYMS